MKSNHQFKHFPHFVLRTPLHSVNFYKELTSEIIISSQRLRELFKNPSIQEAVFLASPPLYHELQKWYNNEIKSAKEIQKIEYSLLKYLSRMSSRCTPFGLFAGCALGNFDSSTKITVGNQKDHFRHTRLDMNYLVALSYNSSFFDTSLPIISKTNP